MALGWQPQATSSMANACAAVALMKAASPGRKRVCENSTLALPCGSPCAATVRTACTTASLRAARISPIVSMMPVRAMSSAASGALVNAAEKRAKSRVMGAGVRSLIHPAKGRWFVRGAW